MPLCTVLPRTYLYPDSRYSLSLQRQPLSVSCTSLEASVPLLYSCTSSALSHFVNMDSTHVSRHGKAAAFSVISWSPGPLKAQVDPYFKEDTGMEVRDVGVEEICPGGVERAQLIAQKWRMATLRLLRFTHVLQLAGGTCGWPRANATRSSTQPPPSPPSQHASYPTRPSPSASLIFL